MARAEHREMVSLRFCGLETDHSSDGAPHREAMLSVLTQLALLLNKSEG